MFKIVLSTKSNMRPSVVMQQNDLPTSLFSKCLRIFPISCNRLETVTLSTTSCSASSSWGLRPFFLCWNS
uniref:Ovule protein n=1 Tax=Heterorhabditis bacteriophora TaxID=37862 RepID=A0A1I7WI36_HETBA